MRDKGVYRPPFLLVLVFLQVFNPLQGGPCTDGTHTCDAITQRCVETTPTTTTIPNDNNDNNSTDTTTSSSTTTITTASTTTNTTTTTTTNFTCECIKVDQQLDDSGNCTEIPDSQMLYLTTPINTTGADIGVVFQILSDASYSENVLKVIYQTVTSLPSYKGIKFLEYRVGTVPDFRISVFILVFKENITTDILQAVARAALKAEEVGIISLLISNDTVSVAGYTGIFNTEDDTHTQEDDIDWCSSPLLYSCRANSTCHDGGLRYTCPCDLGFYDDGTSCYVCQDDFHYGSNCALPCDCVVNNTKSCDHVNGTCFCKDQWEGSTCDNDADECARNNGLCGDPDFYQCVNLVGGYRCVCAEGMLVDQNSGQCRGATIKGTSPFDTDGTRDLQLVCEVINKTEVSRYDWNADCLQQEEERCILRPQRPWDDGKLVTCSVYFKNGLTHTAKFTVDLNYPPPSTPLIEGYTSGEKLFAGQTLKMTCSVISGKPLVTSVHFSCPGHDDITPDVISSTAVTSMLTIELTSSDDGIVCTCSAVWKNGLWYTQSSSRILRVVSDAGTGSGTGTGTGPEPLDFKWYVIFGTLGLFFVLLIVLMVFMCRRQGQGQSQAPSARHRSATTSAENSGSGTTDTGVSNTGTDNGARTGFPEPHTGGLRFENARAAGMNETHFWPAPRQHVWRHLHGRPLPQQWRSTEDLRAVGTGMDPKRAAGMDSDRRRGSVDSQWRRGESGHRRNGGGSQSGLYDQIRPHDFLLSGQSSDTYLHATSSTPHSYMRSQSREPFGSAAPLPEPPGDYNRM